MTASSSQMSAEDGEEKERRKAEGRRSVRSKLEAGGRTSKLSQLSIL